MRRNGGVPGGIIGRELLVFMPRSSRKVPSEIFGGSSIKVEGLR